MSIHSRSLRILLFGLLFAAYTFTQLAWSATPSGIGENRAGYYARQGNDGTPAKAAGNNIYIKFFDDRWIAVLYIPYPYAKVVKPSAINRVFERARAQVSTGSFIRGGFGELDQPATFRFERYGYLEDRVVFECGSLSPCTIRFGNDDLELIKPGVINEHIIRYEHVDSP